MNAFQYVLTSAQLTKHYEVVQFLCQHPNERYTLAQLDTLLPHGVAVQRFPEEWFDLIADGACWHRSIELQRPPPGGDATDEESTSASSPLKDTSTAAPGLMSVVDASAAAARSQAARRLSYVLSCVRAEIRTLADLRARLESPSTLLDAEGCVAVHTDQILIDARLVLQAQRTGLVYYFPDTYDRGAFRKFGVKEAPAGSPTGLDAAGGGGGKARAGQATAALLDAFASREDDGRGGRGGGGGGGSSGGDGSRAVTVLSLPAGCRVQHQLLTRRGVPEQEAYSLPTRLFVGERLRLIFDNATAVRELGARGDLQVDLMMRGVRPSKTDPTVVGPSAQHLFNALQTEPPAPLRIRKETQSVRHAVAAPAPASCASAAPAAMLAPAPVLISSTTKVELEAVYPCTLTLVLTVNKVENLLTMEVMEETAALPGVLILRDRQLDSFALPEKDALPDTIVNPPISANYPFQSVDPTAQPTTLAAWAELVPLPWTQNPSPVVLSLRDATYPSQHATLQAATRAVFSAQSLADEARVRQTAERLRREAARKESVGGKRRATRLRSDLVLSNRHLLHFGFNFSIPFTPPPH